MQKHLLKIIGCLVFLSAAIFAAPASLFGLAISKTSAIKVKKFEGTIWNGKAVDVDYNQMPIGTIAFKTSPFAIFTGTLQANINVTGSSLSGTGKILMRPLGAMRVRDLDMVLDIAATGSRYKILGLRPSGAVKINVSNFSFSKSGCEALEGKLSTNALQSMLSYHQIDGFELQGPVFCDGKSYQGNFSGKNSEMSGTAVFRLSPKFDYTADARVIASSVNAENVLTLLGFEKNIDGYAYIGSGSLLKNRKQQ